MRAAFDFYKAYTVFEPAQRDPAGVRIRVIVIVIVILILIIGIVWVRASCCDSCCTGSFHL